MKKTRLTHEKFGSRQQVSFQFELGDLEVLVTS